MFADGAFRFAAIYLCDRGAALACTVTVVAGLHVDDATGDNIRLPLENCDRAVERLRQMTA